MAKSGGLGDNLWISGQDLSGDTATVDDCSGGPAMLEFTDITQLAMARQGGERDGVIQWTSFFDPAVSKSHAILKGLPTTDVTVTYARGTTLGNPAACMVAKQVGYDPKRGADGSLLFKVDAMANAFGLEWGVQLTAGIRSDVAATLGTGVDDVATVSTLFGWQAYLHVFSFTGTSMTATISDSADNAAFTPLTGGAFVAASAVGTQRIASASPTATVRRYLRVDSSGTFSQCSFAVVFVRNIGVSFAA